MYRFNPLSQNRRKYLVKYLKNYLRRRTKPDDSPTGFAAQFSFYVRLLDEVAATDPTPSGEYCFWILRLLLTNKIDSTEDFYKIHNLLIDFHHIKSRLPVDLRNINKYVDFPHLYNVVTKFLPRTLSKVELQQRGQRVIYAGPIYTFIEITTPEAAVKAAQNTGWCTCNVDTAASYLKSSPLYLILKNGKRFLQAHPASNQIMQTDDSPYQGEDPYLAELFAHLVPDLYCFEHELLKTAVCHNCYGGGCPKCGTNVIKCPDCTNYTCLSCADICNSCDIVICNEHEFNECSVCGELICEDCTNTCSDCYDAICPEDSQGCGVCHDTIICVECATRCGECGEYYCGSCGTDCVGCGKEFCQNCAEGYSCKECGVTLCRDCQYECVTCGKELCRDCAKGEFDYFCSECALEEGIE